jgi:hypothetical protein
MWRVRHTTLLKGARIIPEVPQVAEYAQAQSKSTKEFLPSGMGELPESCHVRGREIVDDFAKFRCERRRASP